MSALSEFKCPHCGGKLEFDAYTQKMKCPYCDSELDIAALQKAEEEFSAVDKEDNLITENNGGQSWEYGEANGIVSYSCRTCGGEILADQTTGATHCPYCGNPVVMNQQFAGMLKPDLVVPFSVTKEQAKEMLKKHYAGKKLLPKVFSSENHLDEIKGVYVPFWLFDADVDASVSYKMTNVRTWQDAHYAYTDTSHFSGFRQGNLSFEGVPVDGSQKMPDELMESIEPYDLSQAVPFKTAYLAGFMADKYDVENEACIGRANERIKKSTEDAFRATVNGYASVEVNDSFVDVKSSRSRYALLPVWLLTTKFNGEQFLFAVNGQTGKIVGDLPVDKGLANKYRLIYTLIAGAASYAVIYLLASFGGWL